eukprot:jgi/Mesen1/4878/ME000244S04057
MASVGLLFSPSQTFLGLQLSGNADTAPQRIISAAFCGHRQLTRVNGPCSSSCSSSKHVTESVLLRSHGRRQHLSHSGVRCSASAVDKAPVATPEEKLAGPELDRWQSCVAVVEEIGFEREEAGQLLSKAYGWSTKTYWREEKVEVVPSQEELKATVEYLEGLGVQGPDLMKVIKAFPYVLACSLEDRIKVNVAQMEKEWYISGKSLKSTLLRKPMVLGYYLDCRGDCIAECDHCWARF